MLSDVEEEGTRSIEGGYNSQGEAISIDIPAAYCQVGLCNENIGIDEVARPYLGAKDCKEKKGNERHNISKAKCLLGQLADEYREQPPLSTG